ncbi:hypothetical protein NL50_03745 [Clostridium acetobutylicum]|nr:hypothetical protein NL50_03745 [Clostridium acetobutylicum]
MLQVGQLQIINYSDYKLILKEIHSSKMVLWDDSFPNIIKPDEIIKVDIQWSAEEEINKTQNTAEALYLIDNTDNYFEIQARWEKKPTLKIDWKNTINDKRFFSRKLPEIMDLGWQSGGVITLTFMQNSISNELQYT